MQSHFAQLRNIRPIHVSRSLRRSFDLDLAPGATLKRPTTNARPDHRVQSLHEGRSRRVFRRIKV
jgi:hypothetical protein